MILANLFQVIISNVKKRYENLLTIYGLNSQSNMSTVSQKSVNSQSKVSKKSVNTQSKGRKKPNPNKVEITSYY